MPTTYLGIRSVTELTKAGLATMGEEAYWGDFTDYMTIYNWALFALIGCSVIFDAPFDWLHEFLESKSSKLKGGAEG